MDTINEGDILNAEALLKHAGIDVGMRVADMGAGREGTFVFTAARMVTVTGHVYALDVVKEVLGALEASAQSQGLDNVTTVWTDLELYGATAQVADGSLDLGILSDTLFQSPEKEDMMRECLRMVKSGGKMLIVEWKPAETAIGPPAQQRVNPDEVRRLAQQLQLQVVDEFEAGEYHWGMILQK